MMDWLHTLLARRAIRRLPAIRIMTQAVDAMADGVSHSRLAVSILDEAGARVGDAVYSLPKLMDRIQLHQLRLLPGAHRHDYGLAFLLTLHQHYGLPIAPLYEIDHAVERFWQTALRLRPDGLEVVVERS